MKWDDKVDEYVNDEKSIKGFAGDNRWLSNFWPCLVVFENKEYKNSEAAYQAAKTKDLAKREVFEGLEAGKAKRLGQEIELRSDWLDVRLDVMYEIIKDKFCRNPELTVKLLQTGDKFIEETNWWDDTFWGVCKGLGQNQLGQIIMRVRHELKNDSC